MKQAFISIVLIAIVSTLLAAKTVSLPDILKPDTLAVDANHLYIVEGIQVSVYSSKDFKLKKKFGREGEGPQEFKKSGGGNMPSLTLYPQPDHLFVCSQNKATFFKPDGTFIKEVRTGSIIGRFAPMGDKYTGLGFAREDNKPSLVIGLYDKDFKKEKDLLTLPMPFVPGQKVDPIRIYFLSDAFMFYSEGKKSFVIDENNNVQVFNEKGETVATLSYDYPKVKLTDSLKAKYDAFFSQDNRFRQMYKNGKARNMMEFSEFLPTIKTYRVSDGKVYVISNKIENRAFETVIFSDTGKFLRKTYLKLEQPNILEIFPFTIYKGKIYQLVENEDEEEWELWVNEIK
jgi:uncharacterized pyridoxamine 5'-phosphate oxidase family protein